MGELTSLERESAERAAAEPMLAQVKQWAAVNSGTSNLDGLSEVAGLLGDAFSALPGELALLGAAPAEAIEPNGKTRPLQFGRNLHLTVRPDAPIQLLLTGHMDTVFGADHPFQTLSEIEDGVIGGPGVADMKGGI